MSEEQRSQPGCIAARMQPAFRHGLLSRLGLLVVDLDGTLLGPDRTIGAADAVALRRAAAAGVTLCVATGRGLHSARPVLATLPVPAYAALHNGALMLAPNGTELWRTPLHPAAVAAALPVVRAAGLHPLLYARQLAPRPQDTAAPQRAGEAHFSRSPPLVEAERRAPRPEVVAGPQPATGLIRAEPGRLPDEQRRRTEGRHGDGSRSAGEPRLAAGSQPSPEPQHASPQSAGPLPAGAGQGAGRVQLTPCHEAAGGLPVAGTGQLPAARHPAGAAMHAREPRPGAARQPGDARRTAVRTTPLGVPKPPPLAGALRAREPRPGAARQRGDARCAATSTTAPNVPQPPPDLALVLEREARHSPYTQAYLGTKEAILEVTGDLRGARHRGVLGLVAFGPRAAVTAAAGALEPLHGRLVSWWSTPLHDAAYLLEVVAPQGTKRGAAERLTHRLGLTRDRVVAIGDNNNDLELLNYAGVGIAMANATPELRAAADFVTTSNTQAGVAHALEWLAVEPTR